MRWWCACVVCVVCAGEIAQAQPPVIGASLGVVFPSDRLTKRTDFLGAFLLPAPSVGVHSRWGSASRFKSAWEGAIEMAIFQSSEELRLRTLYVPVRLKYVREVANVQDVGLHVSTAGGLAFVSTNLGARRALTLGLLTLGGQLQRAIHGLTVALGFEAGVHVQGAHGRIHDVLPVFQLRLTVFS